MICKVHNGKELHIPFGGSLIGYRFDWVKLTPKDAVAINKFAREDIVGYVLLLQSKICAMPPEKQL